MALVTYLIGPCTGGASILVDFDSSSLPAVNGNYYLTFTGGTTAGCYDIIDNAEPATGIDKVLTLSIDYTDCITCQAIVTPTPTVTTTQTSTPTQTVTNTSTITNTPSVTTTQTSTPTQTVTKTQTPTLTQTVTPTQTVTKTQTPTPTGTASVTSTPTPTVTKTPTNTPTISVTPSNTPNVCKTYELYGGTDGSTFVGKNCEGFTFNIPVQPYNTTIVCATEVFVVQGNGYYVSIGSCPLPTPTPSVTSSVTPTNTATNTATPSVTPTQTGTPAVTPTQTGTPTVTPTKTTTPTPTGTPTGTPALTPTPSVTIGFVKYVNQQYQYTIGMLGNVSGGTEMVPSGATVPYQVMTSEDGDEVIVQLNAISLGGFNGLNN